MIMSNCFQSCIVQAYVGYKLFAMSVRCMASSLTDVHILYVDAGGDCVRLINKSPVVSYNKSYYVFS